MRLTSGDGRSLTLAIEDYQFPDFPVAGEHDHDANWLMVCCQVTDGASCWSFRDPCLLTWEALKLGEWLGRVAAGEVPERLAFLEPDLAFDLSAESPQETALRVHLRQRSVPVAGRGGDSKHVVEFALTTLDLTQLRLDWDAELRSFPIRTTPDSVAARATLDFRCSGNPPYAGLRDLLAARGINSRTDCLVELSASGDGREFGVVVTAARRVFTFELHHARGGDAAEWIGGAAIANWTDITASWQQSPQAPQVRDGLRMLEQ